MTCKVFMFKNTVDHVRDRFEPAMRVVWEPCRFLNMKFVQHQEGIKVSKLLGSNRPSNAGTDTIALFLNVVIQPIGNRTLYAPIKWRMFDEWRTFVSLDWVRTRLKTAWRTRRDMLILSEVKRSLYRSRRKLVTTRNTVKRNMVQSVVCQWFVTIHRAISF